MMMVGGDGDDVRARMQAQVHATRTHTASEVPGLLPIGACEHGLNEPQ